MDECISKKIPEGRHFVGIDVGSQRSPTSVCCIFRQGDDVDFSCRGFYSKRKLALERCCEISHDVSDWLVSLNLCSPVVVIELIGAIFNMVGRSHHLLAGAISSALSRAIVGCEIATQAPTSIRKVVLGDATKKAIKKEEIHNELRKVCDLVGACSCPDDIDALMCALCAAKKNTKEKG